MLDTLPHRPRVLVTRAEQETILRWAPDEDVVSVFTAAPPVRRRIERAGYRPVRVSTVRGWPVGWFYRIPMAELHWRVGLTRRRPLTAAERSAARDRLAAGRLARSSP